MDPTLLIIVAVLCLAIGYFANGLLSNRRSNPPLQADQTADQPVPDPNAAASVEEKAAPEITPVTPIIGKTRLDMATFWREQPSGVLRADMDGRTIKTNAELTPEQRRRLLLVVTDLRPWLTPPAAPEADAVAVGADQATAAKPMPRPIAIPAPPAPVVLGLDGKPAAPASIVGQINHILQDKLVGTPLEDRRISLIEMPGHTVAVKIGIDQFATIDEVPDPEIQAIIRAAVKIWEGRAG